MNILEALNEQVNCELESAYIYSSMASWFNNEELPGMESFMKKQAMEEIEHADKMISFLQNLGHKVVYRPINPGDGNYKDIYDVFNSALKHEKVVTAAINHLVKQAREEGDLRVESFLQWYVNEQVEEEAGFESILTKLSRVKDNWSGIYIFDGQLGQR